MSLDLAEPLFGERAALGEAVRRDISEAMVVVVDARHRRADGLEREPVVDELTRKRDEGGVYGWSARAALVRFLLFSRGRGRGGGRARRLVGVRLVAERAHAPAKLAEHVRQLPRAEHDQNDHEQE